MSCHFLKLNDSQTDLIGSQQQLSKFDTLSFIGDSKTTLVTSARNKEDSIKKHVDSIYTGIGSIYPYK